VAPGPSPPAEGPDVLIGGEVMVLEAGGASGAESGPFSEYAADMVSVIALAIIFSQKGSKEGKVRG
jgi:hypothetical protein